MSVDSYRCLGSLEPPKHGYPVIELCEQCGEAPWDEIWSPDGLGGHEILVCDPCFDWLEENNRA